MLASESDAEWFRGVVRVLAGDMSRAAIGRLLGLNASYVSKVARGERHAVRQATIEDVARRLRVSGRPDSVELVARRYVARGLAEADAGRFPVEPPDHPAQPHARWALDLYRECQRDAEADPWHEPGGAERRFIAKLREYAGAE